MNSLKLFDPYDVYESFKHMRIIRLSIESMTMETFLAKYCKELQKLMKILDQSEATSGCMFLVAGTAKVNCLVMRYMSTICKKTVQFFLTQTENEPVRFQTYNYLRLELESHNEINEFLECLSDGVITLANDQVCFEEKTRKKFDYKFFTTTVDKIKNVQH